MSVYTCYDIVVIQVEIYFHSCSCTCTCIRHLFVIVLSLILRMPKKDMYNAELEHKVYSIVTVNLTVTIINYQCVSLLLMSINFVTDVYGTLYMCIAYVRGCCIAIVQLFHAVYR